MDLSNFDKDENGEERDGASKKLFDGEEESNSPAHKRTKRSLGALKSNPRYTKSTTASKKGSNVATLQQHTMFINFGITLTTEDKSRKFAIKVKDLLMNLKLLDQTASFVELSPKNEHQPKIISQEINIPTNFTQLGQFIVFSGDGIFKIQKKWNNSNGKQT